MRESKIFSELELESLDTRMQGDKKDVNGVFAGRVKPKVKEIVNVWCPLKKDLKKLIKKNKKKKVQKNGKKRI
jgi:hypothetical protein